MAWRLGLAFNHLTFFTQQFITFGNHRQRRTIVFFIALFAAQQRAPASFSQETGFGVKFTASNIKIDGAFAEHRIGTELH
ncbi:hypothetical protein D3C75_597650 [compost metagenome]